MTFIYPKYFSGRAQLAGAVVSAIDTFYDDSAEIRDSCNLNYSIDTSLVLTISVSVLVILTVSFMMSRSKKIESMPKTIHEDQIMMENKSELDYKEIEEDSKIEGIEDQKDDIAQIDEFVQNDELESNPCDINLAGDKTKVSPEDITDGEELGDKIDSEKLQLEEHNDSSNTCQSSTVLEQISNYDNNSVEK